MVHRIKIGELLVRAGVLDEFRLNAALGEQVRWGGKLGKILVDMSFVSEPVLVRALSKQLGVPLARLDELDVPEDLMAKLAWDFVRDHAVCPERFAPDRRTLIVAMADPANVVTIDEISRRTGFRVEPTLGGERAIARAIADLYGARSVQEIELDDGLLVDNLGQVFDPSSPPAGGRAPSNPRRSGHAPVAPTIPVIEESPARSDQITVEALDAAQQRQLAAIRAMVDLLVDKGLFTREEYRARLSRR